MTVPVEPSAKNDTVIRKNTHIPLAVLGEKRDLTY
jgi:hypothetical protein